MRLQDVQGRKEGRKGERILYSTVAAECCTMLNNHRVLEARILDILCGLILL